MIGLVVLQLGVAHAAEVTFGSYGRVFLGTDLQGGNANAADVVTRPSRLEKGTYTELDVIFQEDGVGGLDWRAVVTPAIAGEPFHYDGEWDADLAVRNLYAQAEGAGFHTWVGSRMWRGDDVYLWDFWPLDSLNLVGAGVGHGTDTWWVRGAAGANRITANGWQVQEVDEVVPGGVGVRTVEILDRQRAVAALKGGGMIVPEGPVQLRLQGYAELQVLPSGSRLYGDERVADPLPPDRGGVLGVQLSTWGWADGGFAHLWYRYGSGLSAFGELNAPTTGLARDRTVKAAHEHLVAAAANHDTERVSLLFGAWTRAFRDADELTDDWDDRVELAAAFRPTVWFRPYAGLSVEASQQAFVSGGLDPAAEQAHVPTVGKLAVAPVLQAHPGSMGRPQIRIQYTYSHLNDAARWQWPESDPRFQSNHHHSVGVGVEWWLDSATYVPGGVPE